MPSDPDRDSDTESAVDPGGDAVGFEELEEGPATASAALLGLVSTDLHAVEGC